jgi:hypothetical protein
MTIDNLENLQNKAFPGSSKASSNFGPQNISRRLELKMAQTSQHSFRSSGEEDRGKLSPEERRNRLINRTNLRIQRASTLAPKLSNGNIDWNATLEKYIIPAIHNQSAPRSIRGNLYHLLSKNILMKDDYKGLDNALTQARKDGKIAWDSVLDGSGRGVLNDFEDYEGPQDFVASIVDYLENAGLYYRNSIPRWYGQKHYVEYWVETGTIARTIRSYVENRQVRVAHNKGNPGWKFAYDNSLRLKTELDRSEHYHYNLDERSQKQIHIFYFGDDDKHGNDMDLFIQEQLEYFGLLDEIDFRRLALTTEQVRRYRLPLNFETGKGVQLDALEAYVPDEFKKIVQNPIDELFDERIHQKVLEEHSIEDVDSRIRRKIRHFLEDHNRGAA